MANDEDPPGECTECHKEVLNPATNRSSKAVKCDLCEKWYHQKCQNVEDSVYKALNSDKGKISLYWMCNDCFQPGRTVMKKMAEIVGKLNEYEERIKTLEVKDANSKEVVKTYAATAAKQ